MALLSNIAAPTTESLIGLLCNNNDLEFLDFGNVILQKDYRKIDTLLLLSGGISGGESIGYAGFVGKGMLTGSVQGEIARSPSVGVILKTIREIGLGRYGGILIISPGNPTDSLNFGLASEKAIKEGIRVKTIPVLESYTNFNLSKSKQRGLSGIILVIKVAGSAALQPMVLDDVYNICQTMVKNMVSIGVCTEVTDKNRCFCKTADIHLTGSFKGEAPNQILPQKAVDILCKLILKEMLHPPNKSQLFIDDLMTPMVLLLNNAGGLSKLEELVLLKNLVYHLHDKDLIIVRAYSGNFLSTPYYKGFHITLLKLFSLDLLKHLDSECSVCGWQRTSQGPEILIPTRMSSKLMRLPERVVLARGPKLNDKGTEIVRIAAQFACEALISCENQINKIDSELGNGNTGTRLKEVAKYMLVRFGCGKFPVDSPCALFELLSKICEQKIGGTMGCIYCILFESLANFFASYHDGMHVTYNLWIQALKSSIGSLAKHSGAKYKDKTLLDPLIACLAKMEETENSMSPLRSFEKGVEAAEEEIIQTKSPGCVFPDSGAHAVGIWMRAILEGMKLRCQ